MKPVKYFDCHLHMRTPDNDGLDSLLAMLHSDPGCVGGNLILNTIDELQVVLQRQSDIPHWLQVVPCIDFFDRFPQNLDCGWVKVHPSIQRLTKADVVRLVAQAKRLKPRLRGVMVHCFPWGRDLDFNCSLELVSALAQAMPELFVLATHGGGYDSWAYRAHVGELKNVVFDFSATLAYYAGSDLLRPLQRYLTHSPERVLFGSDWPSASYKDQWTELEIWSKNAGIEGAQLESLLLQNSSRIWPYWIPKE
jgi:Amidohydrolase